MVEYKIWLLEKRKEMEKIRGEREERGESLGQRKKSKNQWLKLLFYFQLLESKIWACFGIFYWEKTKRDQFKGQLSLLLYII
jgi:hypothetical protein